MEDDFYVKLTITEDISFNSSTLHDNCMISINLPLLITRKLEFILEWTLQYMPQT